MNAFIDGIKTTETQQHYPFILKMIFTHLGLPGKDIDEQADAFVEKAKTEGVQWIQNNLMEYVRNHKKRIAESKNLTAGTLRHYITVIKLFCETNDELLPTVGTINWKKITRGIPKAKSNANDRAPTKEEIRKLLEYPDRRLKPLVLVMCSTGIRVGAWKNLDWKHVEPKFNDKGEVIAAKLTVYDEDAEWYYTFMSAEALKAIYEVSMWVRSFVNNHHHINCEQKYSAILLRNIWVEYLKNRRCII